MSSKPRHRRRADGVVAGPHPATLAPAELAGQCRVDFGRASGPGGQHRNKVETAVRITHMPTGVDAVASERRRQSENRRTAQRRLRLKLALGVRTGIDPGRYRPTGLWAERRQGSKMPVNPRHRDYPALLAESLDVIVSSGFDVGGAAGILGVTMSQLARLVRHNGAAFAMVNEGRVQRGLPALK